MLYLCFLIIRITIIVGLSFKIGASQWTQSLPHLENISCSIENIPKAISSTVSVHYNSFNVSSLVVCHAILVDLIAIIT